MRYEADTKLKAQACDLILSGHDWIIDSAHHLNEGYVWPKLKENPSFKKRNTLPEIPF